MTATICHIKVHLDNCDPVCDELGWYKIFRSQVKISVPCFKVRILSKKISMSVFFKPLKPRNHVFDPLLILYQCDLGEASNDGWP